MQKKTAHLTEKQESGISPHKCGTVDRYDIPGEAILVWTSGTVDKRKHFTNCTQLS